jgi:hypothetical protein
MTGRAGRKGRQKGQAERAGRQGRQKGQADRAGKAASSSKRQAAQQYDEIATAMTGMAHVSTLISTARLGKAQ